MVIGVGRARGAIAEINVTPMADVMIVLLIIFMVATPVIVRAPVRLPDAAHATAHAGERLEILVRSDGVVLLEGAVVPPTALADWLAPRAGRRGVLVQADQEAAYVDVARVLAACRKAGVAEVALETQRRPGS